MNTIDKFNEHIMQSYGRYPLVMEQGNGRRCKDENGTELNLSIVFIKSSFRGRLPWTFSDTLLL